MNLSKKELKRDINRNGFFISMPMSIKKNVPIEFAPQIPDGATYFEGIASNGDINRNGYIIRESAWKDAIAGYMEQPIVLLQHDMNKPIGSCLWAKLTSKGLEVGGYVFDAYTDGRFSKGLFRALSTGHYEIAVEFESDDGEILSEEEFKERFGYSYPANWTLAVTALEWVEFSVVSIGSNRASLITRTNAITNYFMKKNNDEPLDEVEKPVKEAETPPEEPVVDPPAETEAEKVEEPTPPADPVVEPDAVAETPAEPVADEGDKEKEELKNAAKSLLTLADNQAREINALEETVEKLTAEIASLKAPNIRGLHGEAPAKKTCTLAKLFEEKGVEFRS